MKVIFTESITFFQFINIFNFLKQNIFFFWQNNIFGFYLLILYYIGNKKIIKII